MAKKLGPGHTIVTVLCDSGHNTKSKAFNLDWLKEKKINIERTTAQDFIDSYDENRIKISL
jgi:hypothetical protein